MLIKVLTFDGNAINDGTNYRCVLAANLPAGARNSFVDQANADPAWAGVFAGEVRTLALEMQIADYANRHSLGMQARRWFERGKRGRLVVEFNDEGAQYGMECVVQSCTPKQGTRLTLVLQGEANAWRRETASTSSWTATLSGATKSITVAGGVETRLKATFTPTGAPAGGYAYHNLYRLAEPDGISFGARPWCITLDTAALVAAGKMQADGDDLRVFVGDKEVRRWIADMNTSSTKVWFNVTFPRGWRLKLKDPVASSGAVGELVFRSNETNAAALKTLPDRGILYHGTEWFQYAGKDVKRYKVGVVARGILGTTMQAHALGDIFATIGNVVMLRYGNSAASSPASDDADYDTEKPVFDLSQSDNTKWVYTASTVFVDETYPARPGQWSQTAKKKGDVSGSYVFTQNGGSGAPALGLLGGCYEANGRWQNEQLTLAWQTSCAGGFSKISMTGSKYRSTSRWPLTRLERSGAGKKWETVWSESTPVSEDTWTAWTKSSYSIDASQKLLRLLMTGSLKALADALAYFEALTATVEFTSANLPSGALTGEVGSYPLEMRLTNQATGDSVTILYPMQLNKTFTMDGEEFTADYDGVNAHGALQLDDESRAVWIRLNPGSNTLEVESDAIGTLVMGLSWYARRI